MANKPKIRFKGFDDAWEQRKLDDWGTFYYGKSCPKWSVTEDSTTPCIRYGELYTKFGAKIDRVYSYTNMSPENLRFSKGTEVLIPRVGEDPMDYNHCTWLSMPNVAIGEMISVFNTDNNPLFTAMMFNATLQNEFAMRVEGGSVTNLYFEKLKSIEVSFPSIPEQEKIAAYFDSIDHLITLHQRKCDQMKELKKYMLTKMFPQNGAKVPEIRFDGFIDDWEQRKLLSCIQSITDFRGRTPKKLGMDWSESGYLALSALNVKDGYIDFSQDVHYGNQELYDKWMSGKELHRGQVLFTTEAPMGNVAQVPDNKGYILSQRTIAFDVEEKILSENFLATLLRTPNVFNDLIALSSGGTAKGVSQKSLSGLDVVIPKNIDEQNKLADYFINLDNLITLHRRAHFHRRRRTYK